jgi:hypothetical protein
MEVLPSVCGLGVLRRNSYMHFAKNATCFVLYMWKKVTKMYCHCNNLLSTKNTITNFIL